MIEFIDDQLFAFFDMIRTQLLSYIMYVMSMIGEYGAIWVVISIVFLCRKDTRKTGIIMAAALITELILVNGILKHMVARPRPFFRDPSVLFMLSPPDEYSFPSGHAFTAFICTVELFYHRKLYGIIACILAVLISSSRIYFHVHYPTDVIAGMVLGIVCGVLVNYIVGALYDKKT